MKAVLAESVVVIQELLKAGAEVDKRNNVRGTNTIACDRCLRHRPLFVGPSPGLRVARTGSTIAV